MYSQKSLYSQKSMYSQKSLYSEICQLAQQAGAAIMPVYQGITPLNAQTKADHSPVTAADLAAHQIIIEGLHNLTPDIPVLSEEAVPPWSSRQHWRRYWLVDPLDGTKEFLRHNGEFTVNIALIDQGAPVMGVVYVPDSQVLYSASEGQAWKTSHGQRQPIRARKAQPPLILISHTPEQRLNDWLAQQGHHQLRRMGSSLKFCLLAEGVAQLYPRFAPTSIWDTAAGQAVAQAAGAQVRDWQGNLLDYHPRENLLNPGFKVWI